MTHWYKLLDAEGRACNNDANHYQWPLPTKNEDGSWTPGAWTPVIEHVEACKSGYHIVDAAHIIGWAGEKLFEVEVHPEARRDTSQGDKLTVSCCRLLRQIETYRGVAQQAEWAQTFAERAQQFVASYASDAANYADLVVLAARYARRAASAADYEQERDWQVAYICQQLGIEQEKVK